MGHYFAALVEFWLRFCPSIGAKHVLARKGITNSSERESNIVDAFKLKFIVHTAQGDVWHIETAIHLALAKGLEEVDIVATRFSGAFLHESLCWRVLDARNKIQTAAQPRVAKRLQEDFGGTLESMFLLRGYVFYEASVFRELARMRGGAMTLELPRQYTEKWAFMNPHHAIGWWTHHAEELTRWALDDPRWVLLEYKRYWLSPVVAAESAGGQVQVLGDLSIGLHPIDAVATAALPDVVANCKHARVHPILVAELRRAGGGLWVEASRGFVLPRKWSMSVQQGDGSGEANSIEEGPSITKLQLALERMLRVGGGLDQWWSEVDQLAVVAEKTERQSQEAHDRRLAEIWCPPPPEQCLDIAGGLVPALEARWRSAVSDEAEMLDFRSAVLAHIATVPDFTRTIVDGLTELHHSHEQRVLGHMLLDAVQRLMVKRGYAFTDRPLVADTVAAWDCLMEQAIRPGGLLCPKLAAKACRALNLLPPIMSRERIVQCLAQHFETLGYPGTAVASTLRETLLAGAVQLCALSLQAAAASKLCEAELRPLLGWLVAIGEAAVAQALVKPKLSSWSGAKPHLARLLEGTGQAKWARRLQEAPPPAQARAQEQLPLLRLMAGVYVQWVDSGVAAVEAHLFALAAEEGGAVALDVEWQPYEHGQAPTPVELVQLAVTSQCWLLDMPRLMRAEAPATLSLLRRLGSGECVLIGFGLAHDLHRIAESCDGMLPSISVERALDIKRTGSLRELIRTGLGRDIDKAHQCSDWSQRPLGQEQLQYAALDAHVLLQLVVAGGGVPATPADLANTLRTHDWGDTQTLLPPLGPDDVHAALEALGLPSLGGEDERPGTVDCKTLAIVSFDGSAGQAASTGSAFRAVAVLPLDLQLSLPQASAALGVQCLRLARRDELVQLFGYEAGGLGPIGLRPPQCAVLVDAALSEAKYLRVGAGQSDYNIVVARDSFCKALGARSVPIARI